MQILTNTKVQFHASNLEFYFANTDYVLELGLANYGPAFILSPFYYMLGVLFIAMILPIHTLSYLAFLIKYFLFFIYSLLLFNEYIMYHSLAIYICLLTISLFQGLANYGPAFVNKVLLEHSHAHLFTYCLWLFLYYKRHI